MQKRMISLTPMYGNDSNDWIKVRKGLKLMITLATLKAYHHDPFWKIDVLVPSNHAQTMELDKANGNMTWQDAEVMGKDQLLE
jgi:hypothetical protein